MIQQLPYREALKIAEQYPENDEIRRLMERNKSNVAVYGIRQNHTLIAFLITSTTNPIPEKPHRKQLHTYIHTLHKTPSHIRYLLSMYIHPDHQDTDLNKQLIEHVIKQYPQDYFVVDNVSETMCSIYETLGFLAIRREKDCYIMVYIPHAIWVPKYIAAINNVLRYTKERYGKYVITYTDRRTKKVYYFCNRMYSDLWTEYLQEARVFNTPEYAKKIANTLEYTHQYVEQLGVSITHSKKRKVLQPCI